MEKVEHPFLKLDPKYLYKGYRYKIKFYRSESKYNWKKHIYESHQAKFETSAVFDHQTSNYYIFNKPKLRILKENLISHEYISYEGV